MKKLLAMLLCAFTYGCTDVGGASPASEEEQGLMQLVIDEWVVAGMPWKSTCNDQYDNMHILRDNGDKFTAQCVRCPHVPGEECSDECRWGCANGCFTHADGAQGAFNLNKRTPIITVNSNVSEERQTRLILHEMGHFLDECSGLNDWYNHQNTEVTALVQRAQAKARGGL